jgi:hypothetical protein
MSCNCPSHSSSGIICKHMFLANRVTDLSLNFHGTVLPARRPREVDLEETLMDQRAEKRRMIEQIRHAYDCLGRDENWRHTRSNAGLDQISRDGLSRILGAANSLIHLERDTLLSRPDYAKQWK